MSNDHSKTPPVHRGVTLNSLKDELHSLNMRMLLAIQNHDEEIQKDLKERMTAVQSEIEQMCLGYRRQPT